MPVFPRGNPRTQKNNPEDQMADQNIRITHSGMEKISQNDLKENNNQHGGKAEHSNNDIQFFKDANKGQRLFHLRLALWADFIVSADTG